jgi:hypothetical protein
MYGISRIDDSHHFTHAWRVSLRRRGKLLVKNFPDKKYGGSLNALKAAKEHRDKLIEANPPLTRREFAAIRRRNNTSGVTGVYRYAKAYKLADGREKEIWYWEAHWPTDSGKHQKATFSIDQYGDDLARQLAIRARKNELKEVEGFFWASERGAVAHQDDREHGNVVATKSAT